MVIRFWIVSAAFGALALHSSSSWVRKFICRCRNVSAFSVLGQGGSGLEVVSWAVDHLGERVSSVTTYGGASSEPSDRTRALEARGARFVYGTEVVEGTYDICVASPGISEFSEFFRNAGAVSGEIMGEPEFAWRYRPNAGAPSPVPTGRRR